jgi:hypothetical protein
MDMGPRLPFLTLNRRTIAVVGAEALAGNALNCGFGRRFERSYSAPFP